MLRCQDHQWLPGNISAGPGPSSMPVLCAGSLRSNPTNQQAHLISGPEIFFFFFFLQISLGLEQPRISGSLTFCEPQEREAQPPRRPGTLLQQPPRGFPRMSSPHTHTSARLLGFWEGLSFTQA